MMRERPQESVDDKIVSTGQAQLVGEYIRHLRSKGGQYVYISKRELPLIEGRRYLAVAVEIDGLIWEKSEQERVTISRGSYLVLEVDSAPIVDKGLYELTYRGESLIRQVKVDEADPKRLILYGLGSPIIAAKAEVQIHGRFVGVSHGYQPLTP